MRFGKSAVVGYRQKPKDANDDAIEESFTSGVVAFEPEGGECQQGNDQ